MPNHFLTIGLCGRDYEKLEQMGLEDYDDIDFSPIEGANLCKVACELPDELKGIVSSTPPYRLRNKATGELFTENENGECDRQEYEVVVLSEEEIESLELKYGGSTWYEWANNTWGTRWGTYSTKIHELGGDGSPVMIEFQSAWGPPNAETMRKIEDYLCNTFALKNITWVGHDPYDNRTVEIEINSHDCV